MSAYKVAALVSIDGSAIVLFTVCAGALMTRVNIIDRYGSDSLGGMIFNLFLPMLLFTEIIESLDTSKFSQFGMLLLFCLIHISIGCLIGFILGKITRASSKNLKLIMISVSFQETTAIPLIFASVLADSSVADGISNFKEDALSYVLIFTVFTTFFKWTLAYWIIKSTQETQENQEKLVDEHEMELEKQEKKKAEGFLWTIKKIMNPPTCATLLAIPLALIPYSRQYIFYGSGAVLSGNIFKAFVTMGSTVSPLICILLGNKVSHGYPPTANLSNLHIFVIILGKQVIMPTIGLCLTIFFYKEGVINKVMALMVSIMYAAPTSKQILMMCGTDKQLSDNVSKIFLIMYVFAVVPIMVWTMVFIIVI